MYNYLHVILHVTIKKINRSPNSVSEISLLLCCTPGFFIIIRQVAEVVVTASDRLLMSVGIFETCKQNMSSLVSLKPRARVFLHSYVHIFAYYLPRQERRRSAII